MRSPRWMTTKIQPEDGDDADQAQLLAERREREVRVDLGDRQPAADHRQALAETRPEQAAAGERVERLDDLVAGAQRVRERIQPDVDPVADVLEQVGHERAAGQEQAQPDHDEAEPAGRRVGQGEEHRRRTGGPLQGRAG